MSKEHIVELSMPAPKGGRAHWENSAGRKRVDKRKGVKAGIHYLCLTLCRKGL